MSRRIYTIAFVFFSMIIGVQIVSAQTSSPTPAATPRNEKNGSIEKALHHIFRIRPRSTTTSNPANFGDVGVLEIGYSYGGFYKGNGFRAEDTGTLTVDFTATERIGIEFEMDTVVSQSFVGAPRSTGAGDARLTIQYDIADEGKRMPSIAAAYFVKFPFASAAKGLGSGRLDHKLVALVSKEFGKTSVDFNAALLINGKPGEKGYVTGGEYSLGLTRQLREKINLELEIFGETKDADQPQGLFASGTFSFDLNKKTSLSFGPIVGLTSNAPRFGLNAGISFSIGSLYGNRR